MIGAALGRTGQAARTLSPSLHHRYRRLLTRGPCRSWGRDVLAVHARHLESGLPPIEVMDALARDLRHALAEGRFDRWIDRPKKAHRNSKRMLARCDNYLPGLRWKLQLFYIPDGHSHPPHRHDGTISCLVVARGALAAREYDRVRALENGGETIMLEQVSDLALIPGDSLVTSDDYHNVHWFGAIDGATVAFNFQIVGLHGGCKPSHELRAYVDPTSASGPGPFPARPMSKAEAETRFARRPLGDFPVLRVGEPMPKAPAPKGISPAPSSEGR